VSPQNKGQLSSDVTASAAHVRIDEQQFGALCQITLRKS
jgi:hypothetical protein